MSSQPLLNPAAIDGLLRYGQPDFVRRMIDLFLETSPKSVQATIASCLAERWQDCSFASHSLKSSSGNLGLVRLSETASQIEDLCRDGSYELARGMVDELQGLFDLSCQALMDRRSQLSAK